MKKDIFSNCLLKRHLVASIVTFLGVSGVFALLFLMNARSNHPKKKNIKKEMSVALTRVKPKQKKKKLRKAPKKVKRLSKMVKAPSPNLSSSLSSISLSDSSFSDIDLSAASKGLLGEDNSLNNVVMTQDVVDTPPKLVKRVNPNYPPRARAKGIDGSVTLSFIVDSTGNVQSIDVLNASPPGIFESAAKFAVSNYKFRPGIYKGKNVSVRGRAIVRFSLS